MTSRFFRWCAGMVAVAVALGAGACQNALDVNNPQLIPEGDLNDPQLVNVLMNTSIAALQTSYSEFVWYSAIITDEALNATNDYRSGELSQRIVELAQGNAGPYNQLARYRATADSVASRIKTLVANPTTDLRLARALAYAGYGYVFMGEFLCTAPINAGPLITDDSLEVLALDRLTQAIAIAVAGRQNLTTVSLAIEHGRNQLIVMPQGHGAVQLCMIAGYRERNCLSRLVGTQGLFYGLPTLVTGIPPGNQPHHRQSFRRIAPVPALSGGG